MSNFTRKVVLGLAGNALVTRSMTRHGLKVGAGRFVAGETLPDALQKSRDLNRQGLAVTLDLLGESVTDEATARAMAQSCAAILTAVGEAGLDANLSIKLTQMGLEISPALARENAALLQETAARYGNFVRIDIEASPVVDATLAIVRELHARQPNVGGAIQAYLYRSTGDLEALAKEGINVRLVKGAYLESPEVAYPSKADTDEAYKRLLAQHLSAGCYTAIATHDDAIIAYAEQFIRENGIPRSQFEFQMLYGIRTERQLELARAGYRTRVYVPFGRDWYPYFVRRLAERPANLWF
ncbi:MAG: proline dehydrogenase family protein, partial [Mycobacterium leprae]